MENNEFEWDDDKATINLQKHGIGFLAALQVFSDPFVHFEDDVSQDYGEDRILATGVAQGRLMTVAFTERGQRIRIISARKANADERRTYDRS